MALLPSMFILTFVTLSIGHAIFTKTMPLVHIVESFVVVTICVGYLTVTMPLFIFPFSCVTFAIAQDPAAEAILFSSVEVAFIEGAIGA